MPVIVPFNPASHTSGQPVVMVGTEHSIKLLETSVTKYKSKRTVLARNGPWCNGQLLLELALACFYI